MAMKPYRGMRRSKRNKALLIISLALLMTVIAGTVVFLITQEFLVFTAEGFRFEFPYARTVDEPPATEPEDESPVIIIEGTEPTTMPTQPPTTVPAVQIRAGLTRARLVTYTDYAASAVEEGLLQRALYIKNTDGAWRIPIELPISGYQPTGEQTALAGEMQGSGDIAVVSVFCDYENAGIFRDYAVKVESGKTWLDTNNIRWFNPYARSADSANPDGVLLAASLVDTCARLEMGEVIFTNLQFPTKGRLDLISYGDNAEGDRIAAINAAAAALRDSLPRDSGMLLSCVLTDAAAERFSDEDSGQKVIELAEYFDILYVPTNDPDYDVSLIWGHIEETGCRIGLWLNSDTAPQREIDFVLIK